MWNFTPHKCLQVFLGLMLLQYISCDCLLPDLDFPLGKVKFIAFIDDENQTFAAELAVLQFVCLDGYLQVGPEFLQCVDEEWSSKVPFCVGMQCPSPPVIDNAMYVINSGANAKPVVGSLAVYSCKDGYELQNGDTNTLRCTLNTRSRTVTWEGEEPVCQVRNSCPNPGVSVHGEVRGGSYLSGDVLRFFCDYGYVLVGNRAIRCLASGFWSSERPLCRPLEDYCDPPPPIRHGNITGKKSGDYFMAEDEARVECDPGYKCEGNQYVVCEKGGYWRESFGFCEEIFCDHPGFLDHGTIPELIGNDMMIFPYNFQISYVCDPGYRVYGGDSWRTCDENGWSGGKPRCDVVQCPDPGIPENGVKIGNNYTVGSRVRFSCFPDYDLLGSIEIYCKPNGEWTGEIARCNMQSNYCPDPGTPVRGFKNMTEYKMGDRVRFRCQPKTFLLGSEIRECLPNRTWSGTPVKCVGRYDFDNGQQVRDILWSKLTEAKEEQSKELEKFEKAHGSLENGSLDVTRMLDLNFPGRIIMYFAFDVSGSITMANFEESIAFAKAIVRKVGISVNGARAGAITFGSRAEGMFLPLNYNSTKDVLEALDRIEHTGGGTAASSALNLIRTEYMPLVKEWLGDAKIKSVIFILTDGKANMGGDPKKEADLLKREEAEIYCIGITGDVKKKVLYDIASVSKYREEERQNVFILQDYKTLSWLVQEITSNNIDYSQCGLGMENIGIAKPTKIVGGVISAEPWPWMAALFWKTGKNSATFLCGGSVIHRHFVLTAAHCMFERSGRRRQEGELLVRLGLTDLTNLTFLQQFEIRKMHIHSKYGQEVPLDYDITLLELDRPIEYNAYVRPICLPPKEIPEDSQFYKPQSIAWAIGWGRTTVLPKFRSIRSTSHPLREVALPIQPREICIESLRDDRRVNRYTDRMICAGEGRGAKDTCKGDSGGALMQSSVNKDGYLTWTQVGIVSWGLGCGVDHEYGFYTHLHRIMPWVENIIENAMKWIKD